MAADSTIRRWAGWRLALTALLLSGCGGEPAPARSPAAVAAAAAAPAPVRDPSACPHDGRWRACTVVERLERAGLVVRLDTAVTRVPFLTPTGAHYVAGGADLRVFLYDDAVLADREGLALDRFTAAPRGGSYRWPGPATLIRAGNLVAVLLSENGRQIERIQLALEAGAPLAEPPPGPQALPATVAH